jgi:hypothetical protein
MNILSLLLALVYTVVVLGTCGYLLSRGFTQSFILWFGAGAALEAVPRIGFHVLEQLPGGISANVRWMAALSVVAMIGTAFFVVGFLSLAAFLIRTKPPEA